MYNTLTDRQTRPFCKRFFRPDVRCADRLPVLGDYAHSECVFSAFCSSEYLCRVIGFPGEAAFVVAGIRADAYRFPENTALCVPGVRDHAHPVILPRLGRADAFRLSRRAVTVPACAGSLKAGWRHEP